jgi:hypothetical protein
MVFIYVSVVQHDPLGSFKAVATPTQKHYVIMSAIVLEDSPQQAFLTFIF